MLILTLTVTLTSRQVHGYCSIQFSNSSLNSMVNDYKLSPGERCQLNTFLKSDILYVVLLLGSKNLLDCNVFHINVRGCITNLFNAIREIDTHTCRHILMQQFLRILLFTYRIKQVQCLWFKYHIYQLHVCY